MLALVLLWFPTLAPTVQVAHPDVLNSPHTAAFHSVSDALNAMSASVGTAYGSQSCGGESAANTVSLLAVFRVLPTLAPTVQSGIQTLSATGFAITKVSSGIIARSRPQFSRGRLNNERECGDILNGMSALRDCQSLTLFCQVLF